MRADGWGHGGIVCGAVVVKDRAAKAMGTGGLRVKRPSSVGYSIALYCAAL